MIRIKQFKHFILLVYLSLMTILNVFAFLLVYYLDKNILYIVSMIAFFILQCLALLYFYFIFGSKNDLFITYDGVFINSEKIHNKEDLINVEKITNYRYKISFKYETHLIDYDVFLTKKQYDYLKELI